MNNTIKKKNQIAWVERLKNEGKTNAEIAQELKIEESTIRRLLGQ